MSEQTQEVDRYFDLDRVISISTTARNASWVFLVVSLLLLIPMFYNFFSIQQFNFNILVSVFFNAIGQIGLALVLFFFFIVLRALSEALYLLLDIEDGIKSRS